MPTVCSETCVGRLRYLGLVLYDADRVAEAAARRGRAGAAGGAARGLPRPARPRGHRGGPRATGIADDWIDAAQRSPIWKLINEYRVALPLHPEYRTMPMVWYIPPLSPVVDVVATRAATARTRATLFAAIDRLRIPMEYLAGLFTAGDVRAGRRRRCGGWPRCARYMRDINLGESRDERDRRRRRA